MSAAAVVRLRRTADEHEHRALDELPQQVDDDGRRAVALHNDHVRFVPKRCQTPGCEGCETDMAAGSDLDVQQTPVRLADLATTGHATSKDAEAATFRKPVGEAHVCAAVDDETNPCGHNADMLSGTCSINARGRLRRDPVTV
jgi:hypothetical protein